jgi:hypothetical protein
MILKINFYINLIIENQKEHQLLQEEFNEEKKKEKSS